MTMPFSDDDLKHLKDCANGYGKHGWPEHRFMECFKERRVAIETLLARLEAMESMADYLAHEDHCIRNRCEAGEPTDDGGYRMKYAGKWYQSSPIDETPKCNCGLDEKYEAWCKSKGE